MDAAGGKQRIPSLDGRIGHGYGTTKQHMGMKPSPDGFPYDTHKIEDPESWEVPFGGDMDAIDRFKNKTNSFGTVFDPNQKSDNSSFADDQNIKGLPAVGELRKYIQSILIEDSAIRLRSRSSEPDGAVNQFGMKVPGGSQFGWSSAYPFDDEESHEPVYSMKDMVDKNLIAIGEIPKK